LSGLIRRNIKVLKAEKEIAARQFAEVLRDVVIRTGQYLRRTPKGSVELDARRAGGE
jgi:hypothetical protein